MNHNRRLSKLLTVYSILFTGFGLFVLFRGECIIEFLNFLQGIVQIGHPMDMPNEPFWKFVAISLLWMLGILCWWAKKDVAARREHIQLMIYCKFFSGFLFIVYFFAFGFITPYLFGGLTDTSLGVIALVYFIRAFPGTLSRLVRLSP